jgi:hypothetical protein
MTTKECLIDFLRNEQKQMNIMFYCNDFEFADRLFKLIKNNGNEHLDTDKSKLNDFPVP